MENPIKMDDLGRKPTIFGSIHILFNGCYVYLLFDLILLTTIWLLLEKSTANFVCISSCQLTVQRPWVPMFGNQCHQVEPTSSPTNLNLIWCFFTVVFFKHPNSPITNTPPFPASRFLEFFSKSHRHQSPTNHGIPWENLVFPGKSYGLRLDGNRCCLRTNHSRVAYGGLGDWWQTTQLEVGEFLYHFHSYIIIYMYYIYM